MARTSTYLNFPGRTEEAFNFYKSVFKTDFSSPIHRMSDAPPMPGAPPLGEVERNLVLHIELPIVGGHVLMGTDAVESMGHTVTFGNNVSLNLEVDARDEADRLFKALSDGGRVLMPLQDMFWGAYYGSLVDRFGVQWMINCATQ
jgi:PhnB protein